LTANFHSAYRCLTILTARLIFSAHSLPSRPVHFRGAIVQAMYGRFHMNGKTLNWAIRLTSLLLLTLATGVLAQDCIPERLGGLINDYTPSNVAGGPYELRGKWSVRLHRESLTADFSAFLDMETSDYGISEAIVDPTNPTTRGAHTHHITMTAPFTYLTSDASGVCPLPPAGTPPTTGPVIVITGTPSVGTPKISANGGSAPFDKNGPSGLQVCITGGTEVTFSNVTLAFSGPAKGHFGSLPIHGVVKTNNEDRDRE
jgi:hypothetical protein